MFSSGVAVSLCHDAVEVIAVGAALSLTLSPGKDFIKNWDVIDANAAPSPRDRLPFRTEMLALNNVRVGFKHHSQIVDRREAVRHISNAEAFLAQTCRDFFGTQFDSISEVDLVQNADAKTLLKNAEAHLLAGEVEDAILRCVDARQILREQIQGLLVPLPRFGRNTLHDGVDLKGVIDPIFEVMRGLSEALIANMCGVDFFEFRAMFAFFPTKSGRQYVSRVGYDQFNTPERVRRCIDVLARFFIQANEHLPSTPTISGPLASSSRHFTYSTPPSTSNGPPSTDL